MANRTFHRLQALEKEIKKLHVRFNTDGSGDVTSTSFPVGITSVAHAANVYTITLDDKYNEFVGAAVLPGVASTYALDSEDVSTNKTVAIEFGTTQASAEIHIELSLKNTSVVK